MLDNKLSFTRYVKVNQAMQGDPALQKLLSKPNTWVGKQNQTGEFFSQEVVEVTAAIHNAGMDAYTLKPQQIVHFATDMLVLKQPPPVAAKSSVPEPESSAPVASPVVKPKAKAKTKAKPKVKAKVKPVTKPKVEQTPEAQETAQANADPVSAPVRLKPKNKVKAARKAVSKPDRVAAPTAAAPPENNGEAKPMAVRFIRVNVPYVPGIALMNNLYAAQQLLEPFVINDPEAKELADKLDEMIEAVHRKTVLPNCAKEDAKSG